MEVKVFHSAIRNVLIGLFTGSVLISSQETIKILSDGFEPQISTYFVWECLIIFYIVIFILYIELFKLYDINSIYTLEVSPRINSENPSYLGIACVLTLFSILLFAFLPLLFVKNHKLFFIVLSILCAVDLFWVIVTKNKLDQVSNLSTKAIMFKTSLNDWKYFDLGFGMISLIIVALIFNDSPGYLIELLTALWLSGLIIIGTLYLLGFNRQ